MTFDPPICIADIVRVMGVLQPHDDATQRAIMAVLGVSGPEPVSLREQPHPEERSVVSPDPVPAQKPVATIDADPLEVVGPQPVSRLDWVESTIVHTPGPLPTLEVAVEPLAQQIVSEERIDPPELEPLFFPNWTRGILTAALSTGSSDGPIDLERSVEVLAHGTVVKQLPRLIRPTVRRGVQMLIDSSQGMTLFRRDQSWMKDQVHRVMGKDNVQVLRFTGSPLRGVRSESTQLISMYTSPQPGTVVLLLTDLGIGQPGLLADRASEQEWLRFVSIVRRARCPIVAFVPYPPKRWPKTLAEKMIVIQWDRATTVGIVRNLVGQAHEVLE